jgi:(aminoalkyl)phosphonate N-acetyltransferase
MDFKIRRAILNDEKEVYDIICALEEEKLDKNSFGSIFRKNINSTKNLYFIIEHSKAILGFINIHIKYVLHHAGKVAEIEEFFIKEEFRSSGIGAQVIKYIIEMLKNENICSLELVSNMKREKAHKFYENNGFKKSHFGFRFNLKD